MDDLQTVRTQLVKQRQHRRHQILLRGTRPHIGRGGWGARGGRWGGAGRCGRPLRRGVVRLPLVAHVVHDVLRGDDRLRGRRVPTLGHVRDVVLRQPPDGLALVVGDVDVVELLQLRQVPDDVRAVRRGVGAGVVAEPEDLEMAEGLEEAHLLQVPNVVLAQIQLLRGSGGGGGRAVE